MSSSGYVYHPDYLRHNTGMHPECSERLSAIMKLLQDSEVIARLHEIDARYATVDQIKTTHEDTYIKHVESMCQREGHLDMDTPVSRDSYNAALLAAGGCLSAGDAVMRGDVENAFCLVRPPGHHAESDRGMGFCLFNNIAILAKYLQSTHGIGRILIVDWDVHHGNGTEHSFYDDSSVMYFSTHQSPLYPGSGGIGSVGRGDGEGYTVDAPLSPGAHDSDFMYVLDEILVPISDQFEPDFVLVSAGFDTHHADALAGMNMSCSGFEQYAKVVKKIADKHCNGRIVVTLEGGYDLKALSHSVMGVFNALGDLGLKVSEPYPAPRDSLSSSTKERVEHIKAVQQKYWKF